MENSVLLGLVPLGIYIIFCFTRYGQIVAVSLGILAASLIGGHSLMDVAAGIRGGLGSFLGYIGLIILLGAGLGEVLKRTQVVNDLVSMVTGKLNVNSQKRAFFVVMFCSVIIVSLLGTMAGGNAILAPILIPIVASVRITPNTMGVLFHGAGATGLFLGPFTPPVVALMEFTGLSYPQYLVNAGIPISVIMWIVTFFWAGYVQRVTEGKKHYSEEEVTAAGKIEWTPTATVRRATIVFLVSMISLVGYGIAIEGGSTFVLAIMLGTALLTGFAARLNMTEIVDTIFEGSKRLIWLFFFFVLLDPFVNFMSDAGTFEALATLLKPYVENGGPVAFLAFSTLVGVFGIPGAAVAQAEVINKMFLPLAQTLNIPMTIWVVVLLVGSQMTSFAIPEGDMQGQMGLAQSDDLKAMLCNGWIIVVFTVIYVIVRAMMLGTA
ncbi:MAG: Na+/H+ antiporter NhaC family protein [Aminivibrio sp.]|nr:Na+/H+ antiporter NhaC family protein [Aminivibrio sp.]MEA4951652.1 Na+/H+ antiporter NhaC family protein [Aminivibrio sp.]